jgi:hypothetical protein
MAWLIGFIAVLAFREHLKHGGQPVQEPEEEEPLWDEWSTSEARSVLGRLPDEE